jgi:ApbE superfamily uncharacterized protein (UPF0280 family)
MRGRCQGRQPMFRHGEILVGYEERLYRARCQSRGLVSFTARVKETDLWIAADNDLTVKAVDFVQRHRRGLENYLSSHSGFLETLSPWPDDPLAPPLVRAMIAASQRAGTGPMAAVAGALAQKVGQDLLTLSTRIVVENGGDLFLAADRDLTVAVDAGKSPLTGRLGVEISAADMPTCLCTSSGTVGHSLSLGRADAATVASDDGALADAVATMLGNKVQENGDMAPALEWVATVPGVKGALLVKADKLAAWGDLTLVDMQEE